MPRIGWECHFCHDINMIGVTRCCSCGEERADWRIWDGSLMQALYWTIAYLVDGAAMEAYHRLTQDQLLAIERKYGIR